MDQRFEQYYEKNILNADANTSAASTVTSSLFSDNVEYNNQVKELEDYYYKTLLNDEDGLNKVKSSENISDASSIIDDTAGFSQQCDESHVSKSNYCNLFDSQNVSTLKKLEVQINSNYFNITNSLPLTSANLQKLSSTNVTKNDENISHKKPIKIVITTAASVNAIDYSGTNINKQLFKTELCETFTTKGFCKYGNKCQFAHGLNELKLKQKTNNFRTKPCINWAKLGYCPYGKRCCFKHGDDRDIQIYKNAGSIIIEDKNIKQISSESPIKHQKNVVKKNLHSDILALEKMTW
ncbi:hypothetical protein TPHA_0A01510 [Tetrapisispora phaffii CBS 4417]|uniref:C3H1-type domain-containing protein n=1 Tax=Tetrapisispora phaffii (strain ATCC 24235 / CBS 4417 / NBRC 1672 / NRRL Y-8282 / UCD 70-5) TaxID=1071381 RepID=G8BMV6_TETPH|nr:hypothetical protein TPHA_0A01510 [Tetrapisispora phaffii CBS 4417]CCE61234.1 hypothetical protein TPHA_0A01510 [Tetrapisispora phaffii CBS 4417]